ncbi:hypothetical protein TNCT_655321 [Trichonephila clavata]|uniref:Uncharacterized protein n=1 Tax=Trichonephila clavata TaxID=2740835 RepID=A0A8X6L4A3_TRICU|nr:hypothetical protein TNCT_655321 [Trichonephila clavata]
MALHNEIHAPISSTDHLKDVFKQDCNSMSDHSFRCIIMYKYKIIAEYFKDRGSNEFQDGFVMFPRYFHLWDCRNTKFTGIRVDCQHRFTVNNNCESGSDW